MNQKTKICHVFEKLKLLRKIRARSAETTDSRSARIVTMVKITESTFWPILVFFCMFISNGKLTNDLNFFGERQK